ncbi:putative zinc-binding protein [Methanofollis sp. UBA420]|mgnify:CR=1 FL=1|uniref:putative zinc-binding protein n=1 Tax=Methanofollis sp. UBA420 TaxID=1915514 RepID=UPI00316AEB1B
MAGWVLVTCSGVSNTGRLTTQAASAFRQRHPSALDDAVPAGRLDTGAVPAGCRVIALDGCADACGRKKLEGLGVVPDAHIVATELGVVKNGMAEVRYDEIARVVSALREAV